MNKKVVEYLSSLVWQQIYENKNKYLPEKTFELGCQAYGEIYLHMTTDDTNVQK